MLHPSRNNTHITYCDTHIHVTVDAEYYLRDLFGGNNPRQGNVLPSTPPTPSPPRVLKEPLVTTLLADDFGPSCVPVAVLVQTVQRARRGDGTRDSEATVVMVREDVRSRADAVRDKARRSFATRAPWRDDSVTDQYYFDLTAYALWKTAADLVPDLDDRDTFVRNVGRAVYRKLVQDELITVPSDTTMADNKNNQRNSIVATVDTVRQVLDVFCQCNFCKSYRLGPDPAPVDPKQRRQSKTKPESEPVIIVDELDVSVLSPCVCACVLLTQQLKMSSGASFPCVGRSPGRWRVSGLSGQRLGTGHPGSRLADHR